MYALLHYEGLAYLRLSGKTNIPIVYTKDYNFEIGRSVCLKEGKDLALIATGTMVGIALDVAEELEKRKISCRVVNMHTVKPLDTKELDRLKDYKLIVSMEEHMVSGGMGSGIAEYYADKEKRPIQQMIGIQNFYLDANEYERLLECCGLTKEKIVRTIEEKYGNIIGE